MARCIAMIEDDREMVVLGRMILEREGYEVIYAHTGPEGLEMLKQREGKVDLILLDVMMFGMDGWQVLTQIRREEKLKDIPVIMLTARKYIEDESAAKGYSGMFQGHLTKPFVVRELLSTIEGVLETAS